MAKAKAKPITKKPEPEFTISESYIPKDLNLDGEARQQLIDSILGLLETSAKAKKIKLNQLHVLQAFTYFKQYNINPINGYTYYIFDKTGNLQIRAKMSCYYFVASRSGLNAGNAKTKFNTNAQGKIVSATATVYSQRKGASRVETTATVYLDEVKKDTEVWRKKPLMRLAQIAYVTAMRLSPLNDGSLSGLYIEAEMDGVDESPRPRPKPKANPKQVKKVVTELRQAKAKPTKITKRHKPSGS